MRAIANQGRKSVNIQGNVAVSPPDLLDLLLLVL